MTRSLTLSGLILTALVAGGCNMTFRPIQPEATTPMGEFARAEQARTSPDRNHPACRDQRSERDAQPEGCRVVVRRDR